MIEEPDADEIAQTNLHYWKEVHKELLSCHHPETIEKIVNMIDYNRSSIWISAHEGEETEPIDTEGEE